MLAAIDRLEVHVLIDNTTDSLSSVPVHVESEFAYLRRNGMRVLAGKELCCAHHGLSFLVTAHQARSRRTVLFDAGPEGDVFERNARRLGIDLGAVESIVLSHGHWDHAGGMLQAIELIRAGSGSAEIPYYAHPKMFASRARQLPDGTMLPMEDVPTLEALANHGARVINTTDPQTFLDDVLRQRGDSTRDTVRTRPTIPLPKDDGRKALGTRSMDRG